MKITNLVELRKSQGLKVQEVADLMNVHHSHVYYLETAQRGLTAKRMTELAKIYGVTLDEIQRLWEGSARDYSDKRGNVLIS